MSVFEGFAAISDPAKVLSAVLFAAAQIWRIDEDAIGREVMAATDGGNIWAPEACRALGVDGRSQLELADQRGRAMGELCETANAVVSVLVGRHPDAWSWRFEDEINAHVLAFAGRVAA